MSKKTTIIISIIAALALCMSAVSMFFALRPVPDAGRDVQYVLYLGTNDKDTNEPVFTPDQAKVQAEEILVDHFGGYTIQDASGGWADDGKLYQEYTLVIYLSDTTADQVHAACKDLIKRFNQSSVLIQANTTTTEFYSGD